MNSALDVSTVNPDAALAARADERLVHAYEQIARADEQLARVTEQLSRLEHDDPRRRAAVPGLQPSRGRPALRGFIGFVLAAGICAAAFAAQSSYGEAARQTIIPWVPSFVSTSWLAAAKPGEAGQPGSSAVQLAAAETTIQQPAPSPQAPVQDVPPAPPIASVPASPDLTQMLQSMARDIATVEQGIEQLKASQAQIAADNARAIEQLRASQEQLTHLAARPVDRPADKPSAAKPSEKPKPAEQATRAKPPAASPAPKPVASAVRKPPTQARAPAQPVQLQPDEQ
jgi:hypothetical protein